MLVNHKLHNLLKLSQVQMRLFPHKTVDEKPKSAFLNIIDDETAICSTCGKETEFVEERADQCPDNFSKDSEYTYVSLGLLNKHDIKTKIKIDTTVKEEWIPEDQQKYKEAIAKELVDISNSLRVVGQLIYSDIFEKPFHVTPNVTSGSRLLSHISSIAVDNNSRYLNLTNSTLTISTNSKLQSINKSQILRWIINNDSQEDITGDIEGIQAALSQKYIRNDFERAINIELVKEFDKRLFKLLTENNVHSTIKSFYEILPIIFDKINDKNTLKFFAEINNLLNKVEAQQDDELFNGRLSQYFFTTSDNLNSVIRELLEPNNLISTNIDIRSGFSINKKTQKAHIDYLLPICSDCVEDIFQECNECGKVKIEDNMLEFDGNKICERCSEDFYSCDGCNSLARSEDMHFVEEDHNSYCESCWRERESEKIDTDDFNNPINLASDSLFFLTGNKQSLEKLLTSLDGLKNKTRGGPASKLRQDFINIFKANGIKEDEAKIIISTIDSAGLGLIGDPVGEQDYKWYIDSYIKAIKNYMSHQESFYSKYPLAIDGDVKTQNIYSGKKIELLKNYQPIPVTYEYDSANRGDNNFVIKMMPTNIFLEQAESLFPGIGKDAWKYFAGSGTQHHPGCIAYARISYDGENLVIDNLQRDADLNNSNPDTYKARFSSEPEKADMAEGALRWFDKKTSKWYIQFTDYLINFAKTNDKKLYLTNFKTQKQKWRSIPDKNMEVYDNLPEELSSASFYRKLQEMKRENPDETAESLVQKIKDGSVSVYPAKDNSPDPDLKIEDLREPVDGIWRLAKKNKIFCLFKKSK